jgi:hypothetical protein
MDDARYDNEIFVVRVWYEPSQSGAAMRGEVNHPVSGKRRYFSNLGELCDFINGAKKSRRSEMERRP